MNLNQILAGLVVYQFVMARLRYKGAWWWLFLFLVVSFWRRIVPSLDC